MRLHRAVFLLIFLLWAAPVSANLDVHPMRVHVDAGRTTSIRVHAQSPRTQYVRATVKRVVEPAGGAEHEVDEPTGDAAALAVTPGMFALAGGGSRLVRVIALTPVAEETAFRVYFEGVRGQDPDAPVEPASATSATLGVSLVWGVLVNVLPADGRVAMQLVDGQLHNRGTLRLGIRRIEQCLAGARTTHDIERSVYPGAALALPFQPASGARLRVDYRLSRDGYREHQQVLLP
ncbi:pilus assembly protein [uncultured Stenotrophomonas sp.]|uniref:pilus assembly protein n=1 Tax=uncultured Stenotrophomonas sp. TaxID=165438 RepID=UPI0028F00943|nr:pilus assembly protein [uncultured Stenotrophomonas sp.]